MALRHFLENADLAYVLEAMPACSVAWRDTVYARVGGPDVYLALLSASTAALFGTCADEQVAAHAERSFGRLGDAT